MKKEEVWLQHKADEIRYWYQVRDIKKGQDKCICKYNFTETNI